MSKFKDLFLNKWLKENHKEAWLLFLDYEVNDGTIPKQMLIGYIIEYMIDNKKEVQISNLNAFDDVIPRIDVEEIYNYLVKDVEDV